MKPWTQKFKHPHVTLQILVANSLVVCAWHQPRTPWGTRWSVLFSALFSSPAHWGALVASLYPLYGLDFSSFLGWVHRQCSPVALVSVCNPSKMHIPSTLDSGSMVGLYEKSPWLKDGVSSLPGSLKQPFMSRTSTPPQSQAPLIDLSLVFFSPKTHFCSHWWSTVSIHKVVLSQLYVCMHGRPSTSMSLDFSR